MTLMNDEQKTIIKTVQKHFDYKFHYEVYNVLSKAFELDLIQPQKTKDDQSGISEPDSNKSE